MQSQLMCNGCRSILLYPRGASNVCCALCNTITTVPPPGMDMSQLICGGCRTLLMYTRGATSVRCSCCHTVNLAPVSNQVAHINCGNCRTTLMYPYGAPSVKCAVCNFVTNVTLSNVRVQHRPNGPGATVPSTSSAMPQSQTQTVVVENPMSVDESGKLVSKNKLHQPIEKKIVKNRCIPTLVSCS
ncbi:Protein LOL2 [Linum perenne]